MDTANPSPQAETDIPEGRINPLVFYGSTTGIVLFALWAMLFTEQANETIYGALAWISGSFGWFYFLTKPFFYALSWLQGVLGNFGLAILALTVGVKLVFFP